MAAANLVHFLEKDSLNKRAVIHQTAQKGAQEVQLSYRILKEANQQFLLEIQPKTGKFHQIRAQLSAIGCPILNDEKYGATLLADKKTIGLHAAKLNFMNPVSQEKISVEAVPTNIYFQNF